MSLTPVFTPGTGPGPGWVNVAFGMTPEVLLLQLGGAAAVFSQRIRCAVQESTVAGRVEMLEFAEQVWLCKVFGGNTWHVVLLRPDSADISGSP